MISWKAFLAEGSPVSLGPVRVREKQKADAEACIALLVGVHNADGYPCYLPDDLRNFLAPPNEVQAWVAEEDGAVIGHVALHDAAVDPTLEAAQRATGLPSERLAVVARLLVSPTARRRGIGARLLLHATAHAWSHNQRAVLDVTQDALAPIALYESAGWVRAESLALHFDDKSLLLWVYVSPDEDSASLPFSEVQPALPLAHGHADWQGSQAAGEPAPRGGIGRALSDGGGVVRRDGPDGHALPGGTGCAAVAGLGTSVRSSRGALPD